MITREDQEREIVRAATWLAAEVTEQNGTACIVFITYNIVNIYN